MPFSQPASVRLFRALARPLAQAIYRLGCRLTLTGFENVPPPGAYIIAMNHLASYDPPLLMAFWPHPPEALGAANMMETFFAGHIMRAYGSIPVHRGEYDRAVLEKALDVLRSGRPFVIAPEGGRTRQAGMREAKPGIAYLALKADVPIVPVGITGTENLIPNWKAFRRPALSMIIGQPFRLPAGPLTRENRHQRLAEYTTLIMRRIAELLPPEYRGVYK
ncbi:MAG: 1-acyl-sn-glycerol-3-phosphate acyltransferase [Chloroflexi bacterium]|nr:1-acyl-sn-glycerol-3-phosphate acyltransferase [Chloroflexota bacterium]